MLAAAISVSLRQVRHVRARFECPGTLPLHHPLGLYPLRGGWVYCLAPEAPQKRNADGAEGIFGLAGRVWASALPPGPP